MKMDLYENIRIRRTELGLTQDELASKLGYKDRSTIAKIESGKSDIPVSKISEFAIALQTTEMRIMGWDTPEGYNLLDERDKGRIEGNIDNLLQDPKYKKAIHGGEVV